MKLKKLPLNFAILNIMLVASITGTAHAEVADAKVTKLDGITVYTAARVVQRLENVTANVAVITRMDIEQRGFKNIGDALKTVPGFSFSRWGGLGGGTNIKLRGMNDANLLILIDGVRQNDPASHAGGAHLAGISLENIERIEVLKGAQSGVWGADAVAGVINIITKRATKDGFETILNLEYGSFNTSTIGLFSSFKQGDFDGSVSLSQQKTDGFSSSTALGKKAYHFEDDSYENKAINLNLGYDINNNNRLSAFFNASETESETDRTLTKDRDGNRLLRGDPARGVAKANNEGSFKGDQPTSFGLNYQNTFNNITSRASANRTIINSFFHSTDLQGNVRNFDYEGITDNIDLNSSFAYNQEDFIIIGVNHTIEDYFRKQEITGRDTVILERKRDNTGVFVNNSNVFNTVKNDTTIFSQALRYDYSSVYGGSTTYRLGLKHNFNDFNNLWVSANHGTAFRPPLFHHLYAGDFATPTLKPETTETFDFTVHFNNLEITYFNHKTTDLIQTRRDPHRHRINLAGDSVFEGVEVGYAISLDAIDSELAVNYTYTDARDDNKVRLVRIPHHQANIFFDYYGFDNLIMGAKVRIVGETIQSDWSLARTDPNHRTTLPVNTTVDLTADYQLSRQLNIYGRIDNIFDNETPTIINRGIAERSFYVGIRYTL